MRRIVKPEPGNTSNASRKSGVAESERVRVSKKDKTGKSPENQGLPRENRQGVADRRVLRSQYLAMIHRIKDVREDLSRPDSDKFDCIIGEVENLHKHVQKPREQVADAEALLDITSNLMTSVKSQSNDSVTPAEFINCLIKEFGNSDRRLDCEEETAQISINWKDIGLAVSPSFRMCRGCCTMVGPMKIELKQRKTAVYRQRERPSERARVEEVDDTGKDEKTDTDKNMATMFNILKRKKRVGLESLILNRMSFAQTVENLFALSFLVKDGRIDIIVDESGSHFVSPKNAPDADSVASGEVTYRHFVFRFDYKDWKLMTNVVPAGEELMPHREVLNVGLDPEAEPIGQSSKGPLPTTPIRKLSRNRGFVIQEESVVEDSPDMNDGKGAGLRRLKRKLN